MLEKKQKGKPIAAAKKPAASNVFDLMGALRASLEKSGKVHANVEAGDIVPSGWNTTEMRCVNVGSAHATKSPMLSKKNRPWTAEDDQKLLALAAAGRSSLLLAAAMKRSKAAVLNRLSALRLREDNRRNNLGETRE